MPGFNYHIHPGSFFDLSMHQDRTSFLDEFLHFQTVPCTPTYIKSVTILPQPLSIMVTYVLSKEPQFVSFLFPQGTHNCTSTTMSYPPVSDTQISDKWILSAFGQGFLLPGNIPLQVIVIAIEQQVIQVYYIILIMEIKPDYA